jgi:uncharacterized membrane protein (UPF0136 family)
MTYSTAQQNKKILFTQDKKIWTLAFATAAVSVLFSFMGAPFLRALSAKANPALFWGVGVLIVATLFLGQLTLGAVYVGAVWTTLGFYSELEKRGVSWKKTIIIAVFMGMLFAIASYLLLVQSSLKINLAEQMTAPVLQTLKQINPDEKISIEQLMSYMPGALIATLFCSLAMGLVFESKVFQLFQIQREKTISALKWLEFRLPDQFIWLALSGFLFCLLRIDSYTSSIVAENIKTIAINISIFTAVAFFLQGVSVLEYLTRFYRVGVFNKSLIYVLIFVWLAPAISFVGLIDYWANFRKMLRKNLAKG